MNGVTLTCTQIQDTNPGGGQQILEDNFDRKSADFDRKSAELLNMSNQSASVRSTPRSLNPELLMREFTQDEQGRIDSLGATDSPSACFQSQFAREVVQVSNFQKVSFVLKFGLSEKAAKFEKIFVVLLIRAPCSVRATETCQKVDEDFSKQMWSSRNIQILPFYFYQVI